MSRRSGKASLLLRGYEALGWVAVVLAVAALLQAPVEARPRGGFVGVGIVIAADRDGSVWVDQVVPGGPADRAGVRADDELLAIDGRSLGGMSLEHVVKLIDGRLGTTVTLTVCSQGQRPRRLRMRRERLDLPRGSRGGNEAARAPVTRQAGSGRPAPRGTVEFTRVSIRDPEIGNREAVSFLVPKGWNVEGGIVWLPNYSILANLRLRISDPHSGAEIQFLPQQNFTWMPHPVVPIRPGADYLGNVFYPPVADVPQFIRTFYMPRALAQLQGARQVGLQQLPGVAEAVASSTGSTVRATRVRYAYTRNGHPWLEDVFVTLAYSGTPQMTLWTVKSAYALRAPRDQFARLEPLMAATVSSRHISLDWYASYRYVQRLFNNRMRGSIRDAAAISATIARNSEEIRRMFDQSYQQSSAVWDRVNRRFSQCIRGVDSYQDPYKDHAVELPSGYRDVWVNAGGSYLLSNDPNFNPNVGDNVAWRRMKRAGGQ